MKNDQIKFILINHINGSKSNQVEEFSFGKTKTLTIGRSSQSDITFGSDSDEMVSRNHAVIEIQKGEETSFSIVDQNSTNGTFLNDEKISGSRTLNVGDKLQIGKGGPTFEFNVTPVPSYLAPRTKVMDIPQATTIMDVNNTLEAPVTPEISEAPLSTPSLPIDTKQGIGKGTVERMIHKEQKKNRNVMYLLGALLLAGLAGGLWYMQGQNSDQPTGTTVIVQEDDGMKPDEIATENRKKVVFLEVGWKLIHTPTGQEIFHVYDAITDPNTGQSSIVPFYIQLADGSIEPLCQAGQPNEYSRLLGNSGAGSGFFVSDNGHIITNRHVAAGWNTRYSFPGDAFPGALYVLDATGNYVISPNQVGPESLMSFVPATMSSLGKEIMTTKSIIKGENEFLDVTLPGRDNRIPATIANISDQHDVAMIKINLPGSQPYVKLDEKSSEVGAGKEVVVMGYPGISPNQIKVLRSQDMLNQNSKTVIRPEPSVTNGTIAKLVSGGSAQDELYTTMGETYQLNINTTGQGNSGGPVFDTNGNVIGIFTYGGGTIQLGTVSFAVPIRYAMDIMGG